jgi:hypothetical protein
LDVLHIPAFIDNPIRHTFVARLFKIQSIKGGLSGNCYVNSIAVQHFTRYAAYILFKPQDAAL